MQTSSQSPGAGRQLTVGMALAVSAAASPAQVFDPSSPPVLQAYEAPLSAGKLEAARTGLTRLLPQATRFPGVLPNPPSDFGYGMVDGVFDIAAADGDRVVASLEGSSSGRLVLGANTLGVRAAHSFDLRNSHATVEGRLAWGHEFRDPAWSGTRLAGDPSDNGFRVAALDQSPNSLLLGLGFSAEATRDLRLYVDLASEFNGGEQMHAISVGLRYRW